jgi:hypothetical protein
MHYTERRYSQLAAAYVRPAANRDDKSKPIPSPPQTEPTQANGPTLSSKAVAVKDGMPICRHADPGWGEESAA